MGSIVAVVGLDLNGYYISRVPELVDQKEVPKRKLCDAAYPHGYDHGLTRKAVHQWENQPPVTVETRKGYVHREPRREAGPPRETTDLLVDANYDRLKMRFDSNDPF